ncbi:MAG: Sugar-specific transcriptional regulator TrmB [candidate division WS6 bacterium OLB20]|uniref:Sugar-specific transcriptional regulator TrmB n=1 Tax=candidate division WS6 bacterium OLB20 TaxID=1617426 RepID=A0A136LZ80_9BACT|nr:MAG: Sugar-specific transcriptional regulator TrmB [candidate division WS6 bacterium OLB20]
MFTKELTDLGLNKGEAEVYASLLQFGEASASEIAKKTNIGRTNVYEYANSLLKRGLVGQFEKSNKIFFRAEDPRMLRDLLDQRKREIRELETTIGDVLPKMDSYYNRNSNRPQMNFFHGSAGYREIMTRVYAESASNELVIMVPDLDLYEPAEPKLRNALLRRQAFTTLIANRGESIAEFNKRDQREMRKTAIVHKSKLLITADTILFDDMVLYGSTGKKSFAVNVIRTPELVKLLRTAVSSIAV